MHANCSNHVIPKNNVSPQKWYFIILKLKKNVLVIELYTIPKSISKNQNFWLNIQYFLHLILSLNKSSSIRIYSLSVYNNLLWKHF